MKICLKSTNEIVFQYNNNELKSQKKKKGWNDEAKKVLCWVGVEILI